MKIGYPCMHRTLGCSASNTFRLKSYTPTKFMETVHANLACLLPILEFNIKNNLLFFRISSDTIPFASHEICQVDWRFHFKEELWEIGRFIKMHNMRISMHPSQFVVLGSPDSKLVQNSIREIEWHCDFLDSLELDSSAKVQIHLGGTYGDKVKSLERFMRTYEKLPEYIKQRLVIENDEHSYSLQDCLFVHQNVRIPVVFDNLHHECLNNQETVREAILLAQSTWSEEDGNPMVDYSSQDPQGRKGKHGETLDENHFENFLYETKDLNFDIMLEIKDKEQSAMKALKSLKQLGRI